VIPARTRLAAAIAVAALGVASATWAAMPLAVAGAVGRLAFIATLAAIAFGALRLVTAPPAPGDTVFGSSGWVVIRARAMAHGLPWAEVALVAILVLEAQHPSRPWHTALLGAALLCYLFGTHLAESGTPPAVLRPQLPVLVAGLGLSLLAAAAGTIPAGGPGPAWLRLVAALTVIAAGILLLPA
jgi:hypothetical protein